MEAIFNYDLKDNKLCEFREYCSKFTYFDRNADTDFVQHMGKYKYQSTAFKSMNVIMWLASQIMLIEYVFFLLPSLICTILLVRYNYKKDVLMEDHRNNLVHAITFTMMRTIVINSTITLIIFFMPIFVFHHILFVLLFGATQFCL
jgi:hypothetical protein